MPIFAAKQLTLRDDRRVSMKKSQLSQPQLTMRQSVAGSLQLCGWSPPEGENQFNEDWLMIYELTSSLRTTNMLFRLQVSFENNYVSLQIVEHPIRNSEFFLNFANDFAALDHLIVELDRFSASASHDDCLSILEEVIERFPGSLFFFVDTGNETPLTLENLRSVVLNDPANT